MIYRCLVTLAMLTIFFITPFSVAGDIKLDRAVKGELGGERKFTFGPGGNVWYQSESTISLTAGQSINLRAEVTGKDRLVAILVLDPKGAVVPSNVNGAKTKTYEALVEEVNATGRYTIIVASTLAGPFTLKVTDASIDEDSVEFLEKRKKELEAELKEVVVKLEAARKR